MDIGKSLWKCVLVGLIPGLGLPVNAAVITYSHDFSAVFPSGLLQYSPGTPIDPGHPETYTEQVPAVSEQSTERRLTFDQFDSSLGTLTGVSISFNASTLYNWLDLHETCDVQNEPGCLVNPELIAYHSLAASITAGSSTASASVVSPTYVHTPGILAASHIHGMNYLDPVSHAGNFDFVNPADLAGFTGSGTLDFVQSVNFWMQLTCEEDSLHCTGIYRTHSWLGAAEVTYTYEPDSSSSASSVPEVPVFALYAIGIFGIYRVNRQNRTMPAENRRSGVGSGADAGPGSCLELSG